MNDKKSLTPLENFRKNLEKLAPEFAKVLPSHIRPERFQRVIMTALQSNSALLEANRNSLYGACLKAATDGLIVDGREAAFVIFKNQVVYMPMIQGIIKRIRNSGEIASINSQVIHEKDTFRYFTDDDGEHVEHSPVLFGDRGEFIGVFAMAITKDGARYIEVMNKEEVEKVRAVSKTKDTGPWVSWYSEMARKTVVRRLAKRLPISTDVEALLENDNETYVLDAKKDASSPPTTSSRLRDLLEDTSPHIEEPTPDFSGDFDGEVTK